MSPREQLTERESRHWRIWLTLVTFLVVGSLVMTACLMYFRPPPVTRHIRRGHERWTEAATPAPVSRNTPSWSTPPAATARPTPPAGPGIVWVNTRSCIYHFPGYRWYGRTIQGKYADEQDALAEGDRAALNERRHANFGGQVPQ